MLFRAGALRNFSDVRWLAIEDGSAGPRHWTSYCLFYSKVTSAKAYWF